jgi:hypothetical protein
MGYFPDTIVMRTVIGAGVEGGLVVVIVIQSESCVFNMHDS